MISVIYGKESKRNNNFWYINESDLKIPIGIEGFKDSISFVRKLVKKQYQGKNFLNFFAYNDLSLWWFIYPTIFPPIQRAINFIIKFNEFLDSNEITSITIKDDFEKLSLIHQICEQKKIELRITKSSYLRFLFSNKIRNKLKRIKYQKVFSDKYSKRLSLYESNRKVNTNISNKILFVASTAYRRSIFDSTSKKIIRGEFLLHPIGEILKKINYDFVGIDIDYTYLGELAILKERLDDDFSWIPLEKINQKNYSNSNIKSFLKLFNKLMNNEDFHSLFSYNNVLFWKHLEFDFRKLNLLPFIPFYINLIDSLGKYFQKNTPKTIFLLYETGPFALAIISAAKKNNIKTIGIQHGLNTKYNTDYSHETFRNRNNYFGMILPDITLVFGNFTKNLLVSEGYPEDKLMVFGNPDYFQLSSFIKTFDPSKLRIKYNISEKQKIILFATGKSQRYYNALGGKLDYDEQVLEHLIKNYSNKKDYFIIVKPHPGEYIEYYNNEIKKSGAKNIKLIQGNLFELLSISDVVIAITSNVLLDSIALKRLTIRVCFEGSTIGLPYDQYNVLVSCDLNSLSTSINKIISNEDAKKKLLENRKIFLKDLYGIPPENPTQLLKSIIN